jgi:hypothetical protein
MSAHWIAVHALQTGLGLVGSVVSGLGMWDAIRDLRAVRERRCNGLRRLMARWHVRNEAFRLLLQLVLMWVGIASAIWPEIPFGIHDMVLVILLLLATLANRVDRHELFDLDLAHHDRSEPC